MSDRISSVGRLKYTLSVVYLPLLIAILLLSQSADCFLRHIPSFTRRYQPIASVALHNAHFHSTLLKALELSEDMVAPYVYDYSDKSIAVFGDTKPFKTQFSALGGRFNPSLRKGGVATPGWVFKKASESEVVQALRKGGIAVNFEARVDAPAATDPSAATATSTGVSTAAATSTSTGVKLEEASSAADGNDTKPEEGNADKAFASSEPLQLIDYSERSIVIFGDSRHLAGAWKVLGGRWNRYLKNEGANRPGWVLSVKHKETARALVDADAALKRRLEKKSSLGSTSTSAGGSADASDDIDVDDEGHDDGDIDATSATSRTSRGTKRKAQDDADPYDGLADSD